MLAKILPYPPSANACWRQWKGRTMVSAEYRDFKRRVALLWGRPTPMDGPLSVEVLLYRPRKAGDIDNRIKPLFDSLNGLAWHDDSQIARLLVERRDDKLNPRAEVLVARMDKETFDHSMSINKGRG